MSKEQEVYFLNAKARGETSAWVTFFSKTQGLISAYCKGAKSPKKSALLQPFTPLWIDVSQKGEQFFVNHLENQGKPSFLEGRVLISALYLNELLTLFLPEREPHPSLFYTYQKTLLTLEHINTAIELEQALRYFELCLLEECGYGLIWTHDADGAPLLAHATYSYRPGAGLIHSHTGHVGEIFLNINNDSSFDTSTLGVLKKILRATIAYHLQGRNLKTRELLT